MDVKELYVKKDTLSIRKQFHDKYSVNPYGFLPWTFDQYEIKAGDRILEIGGGGGSIWKGKQLPEGCEVVFTDLSPLMLEQAKGILGGNCAYSFQEADVENLPFADQEFDIVTANHMLYHVPDLQKGLAEIKRVLKKKAIFYATTLGADSMGELQELFREFEGKGTFSLSANISFHLDNGEDILAEYFDRIEKREYQDALAVTGIDDIIEYVMSYNKIEPRWERDFTEAIKKRFDETGVFRIGKRQGIFICKERK